MADLAATAGELGAEERQPTTCRHGASRVVELRQYTLQPGARDVLIELFDREFIESQEDLGMSVLGQFRDLDDEDRFVWLRGFADMDARRRGLSGFYGGPVWAAHREVANATMIDSDNVLLLRPMSADIHLTRGDRPPRSVRTAATPSTVVTADIYELPTRADPEMLTFFTDRVDRVLAAAGSIAVALLETEPAPNDFPALPVRDDARVIVRVARFDDLRALGAVRDGLVRNTEWLEVERQLRRRTVGPVQTLSLQPTARSLLR